MTNKGYLISITLVFLFVAIFALNKFRQKKEASNVFLYPNTTSVHINNKNIKVEIADTEMLRAKGLSERNGIEKDHGMLFVFDKKDVLPVFWMKNMLIPIDIIWINDGKIIGINEETPPPPSIDTPERDLIKYPSPGLTDYVLEVESGFSKNNNIKTGDEVIIDL